MNKKYTGINCCWRCKQVFITLMRCKNKLDYVCIKCEPFVGLDGPEIGNQSVLHFKQKEVPMEPKQPRTFWDSFKDPYQMGPQTHRLYLLNLLKEKEVQSLLDVGCGTGPIYELIKTEPYQWIAPDQYKGVDYSFAMIDIAKKQFPEGKFEVEDARKLNEPDASWDCVLLMHSLDHLDDYQAAIKEAARVAKRYVCIILWRGFVSEGVHLNDRNMIGKQEGEKPWEDTYLQEYSKEALENAFLDAGLVVEHTAEGDALNSDKSHYNFLYLLKKA